MSNRDGVFDSSVPFHQRKLKQACCCLLVAAIYDARARPAYDTSKQRKHEPQRRPNYFAPAGVIGVTNFDTQGKKKHCLSSARNLLQRARLTVGGIGVLTGVTHS